MAKRHEDKQIFYVCLTIRIILIVGGFFCPPLGVIDGSVLTAAGILLGFATLGIVGKNLSIGKDITFKKGDLEVSFEDEESGS